MNKTAAALACALLIASDTWAATTCRIVSAGTLAFGSYDILSGTPTDTVLNVAVTCDRVGGPQTATLTMRLGTGLNSSSVNARRMITSRSGDLLGYNLYRDASRSNVWGSTDGVDTVSQNITMPKSGAANVTFSIYGRIPALQDVSEGSYGDSVQITLSP